MDLDPLRQFMVVFAVGVVRLTAACAVVPFMGTELIPGQVRNSVIFAWGIIIYPIVAPTVVVDMQSPLVMVALLAKEVFLGMLMGFVSAKVFWLAMNIGFFIDNQRGSSMAQVFDPGSGEQTSPIGQFLNQAMLTMFYVSGGMTLFLGGVFESYLIWPPGSLLPDFSNAFPTFFLDFADDLMRVTVVLSAPIIVVTFLTDFGLGLVNRFAPQLNVFFLSMPIKCLVALLVLAIYMPFLFLHFDREADKTQTELEFLRRLLS